ncbi:MAG: glycosyltransferase family 4 protein [Bacteroidota bacterium]
MKIASVSFGYPDRKQKNKYIFTHEQAKAFIENGHDTDVFDLAADSEIARNSPIDVHEQVRVFRYPKVLKYPSDIFINFRRLKEQKDSISRIVNLEKYDLVLFSFVDVRYLFYLDSFISGGAAAALTAHGGDAMLGYENILFRKAKMILLDKMEYVFAVSDFTGSLVRPYVRNAVKRLIINYNGINKKKLDYLSDFSREFAKKKLNLGSKKKMLLTVCNLVKRKGLDIALEADKILKESYPEFLHIIVGQGPEKAELAELTAKLGLNDNVRFLDYVEDDGELAAFFRASDLYVMLSRTIFEAREAEGFGIVFAEAGYMGVPVVAGNSGGVPSVVKDKVTGYLIDPESESAASVAASVCAELFHNSSLYEEISGNARKYVQQNFDWNKNAARIVAVFEQPASGK